VLRRAMQGILPTAVQWRPGKTDLSQGIEYGLMKFERTRIEQLLKNSEAIEGIVDTTALRGAYQRMLNHRATSVDLSAIWRTVSLDAWLKGIALGDENGVIQYAKAS
jgi:asparagine synthase (glutamine-hydrolysing)